MRKLLSILLVLIMIISTLASCSPDNSEGPENPETQPPAEDGVYADRDVIGRNVATVKINIKEHGTMTLTLDATSAPRTVANFLSLAKSGFYDGTTFYSAQQMDENAALILAGDPTIYGGESSGEMIYGEFAVNGYNANDLSHKRGVISMYHSTSSANDAESAFFISSGDLSYHLDGYYAPFGYITDGFSVLDSIMEMGLYYTDPRTGLVLKSRQPVITSITIEKDIDYSLVSDVYLAPPTADELSQVLGEDAEVKKITASYAPDSVLRTYKTESGCAFQIVKRAEGSLTNILVSVDKSGSITKAINLPLSSLGGSVSLESLEGLNADGISAADLPDEIKTLAKDVVRTGTAVLADDSASKYIYVRDTEGREIYTVEMKVKGYDTPVIILLDKTTAPITVANFVSLVEKGFYDGLDFHRIIKGFMIQGGDDSHLPEEEQAASIKGEFASNGVENDIKHLRGTISMARTSVKDSASSGFFICDADSYWLDGEYAAFGYVISGMETVDAIADYADGKTDNNGNLNSGVEQPTIEYIKIIENVAGE